MPPHRSVSADITRVFWRLASFAFLSVALIVASGFVLKPVFPNGLPFGRAGQVLYLLVLSLAVGLAHLAAAFWEKSGDWAVLGFAPAGWAPKRALLGFVGGVLVLTAPAGALLAIGFARLQPMPTGAWGTFALNVLVVGALAALVDTLAFRGYLHGLVERRWGSWIAVAVSMVLFAALRALAAPISVASIVGALAMGAFLGAVRARSEGIAAPWLAQLGMIWLQGAALHVRVPGLDLESPPNYGLVLGPPAFVTGAGWGLAGGLAAALCLFGAAFVLMRPLPYVPPPLARP